MPPGDHDRSAHRLGTRRGSIDDSGDDETLVPESRAARVVAYDARTPHSRTLLGRYQCYLWRGDDGVTLFDAGEAGSGSLVRDQFAQLGLGPSDLKRIVISHWHDDHAGGVAELLSWGDVEVVAHEADAPVIEHAEDGAPAELVGDEPDLFPVVSEGLVRAPSVQVDRRVRDGGVIDFAGGAIVVSTPGHTPGSIALHLPYLGVVLTGDIAAEYEGSVMLGIFNTDRDEAIRSLMKIAELDADFAGFGHGVPVRSQASRRLQAADLSVFGS